MTVHTHKLEGCTPTPLANYLKALGVLRLLATPANNVSGEAADSAARGWWAAEYFHLQTRFDRDALLHFFLEDYAPSPIIAPWNGGSGFYAGDNTDGFAPLTANPIASRFTPIAKTIRIVQHEIAARKLTERPEGAIKTSFVASLRAHLPEEALDWLDAVLALTTDSVSYPPLLGTGGNDGRLDFTNNFMRRLVSTGRPEGLFNAESGKARPESVDLLMSSIFGEPSPDLSTAAIGQFSPGAAGGPNAGIGYQADSLVNAWDFVLALEGAVMLGGAATRRHQARTEPGASFPFTVNLTGAGCGGADISDEGDARAEFWAPLWSGPSILREIEAVLREGRAVLNGRTVRDGLDFARAVASLGVNRGIGAFQRFGFVMRAGKAYFAVPLDRRQVASKTLGATLIADLDSAGWLTSVRRLAREKNAPARARTAIHRLEDACFEITRPERERDGLQAALVSLGEVVSWLVTNRMGRTKIPPPAKLRKEWARAADDESPEFRVAAALASLGWFQAQDGQNQSDSEAPEDTTSAASAGDFPEADTSSGENSDTAAARQTSPLPMAVHFAPVDGRTIVHSRPRRSWDENESARVVWGNGSLVQNMIAVLERRLIEQASLGLTDKPLTGVTPARLADVMAFLEGPFDDARCAALLAGLVWARPTRLYSPESNGAIPFVYAALKPLFTPDTELRENPNPLQPTRQVLSDTSRLPIPSGFIARIRSERYGAVDDAIRAALGRARASGIGSPFNQSLRNAAGEFRFSSGIKADRIAAALLVPIDSDALCQVMERAYPKKLPMEDVNHAA
jgi:CRISPR-associated protein Csx17